MRTGFVWLHRYVGLLLAGFLLLSGVTGGLLAWYHELDAAINPAWTRVVPPVDASGRVAAPLDALRLRASVQAAYPSARVHHIPMAPLKPDASLSYAIEAAQDANGHTAELPVNEVFVDPYTGEVLGGRRWGDLSQGVANLMPFVYRLHQSLALGPVGAWLLGVMAVLWTLDCFVGAYLTLPVRVRRHGASARFDLNSWWARWQPAWKVRWHAGGYKRHIDLHRAGGLWPWLLLVMLAWSGVSLSLHGEVYRPIMGAMLPMQAEIDEGLAPLAEQDQSPEPPMGWAPALSAARAHLAAWRDPRHPSDGLRVIREDRASYFAAKGFFRMLVYSDRDIGSHHGRTAVFLDARTGRLLGVHVPTGQAAGDTVTTWLQTLHMARIWGLPFKAVMTFTGAAVVMLSLTGVVIWWRKRQGRVRVALTRTGLPKARNS